MTVTTVTDMGSKKPRVRTKRNAKQQDESPSRLKLAKVLRSSTRENIEDAVTHIVRESEYLDAMMPPELREAFRKWSDRQRDIQFQNWEHRLREVAHVAGGFADLLAKVRTSPVAPKKPTPKSR